MVVAVVILGLVVAVLTATVIVLWGRLREMRSTMVQAVDRIGRSEIQPSMPPEKALERAVERAEANLDDVELRQIQYLSAIHGADFGILVAGFDGQVVFANPQAERYLGARHGDAVAEVRLRELLNSVASTGKAAEEELDIYTPVRRLLGLRALPMRHGESTVGVVLYIHDLTERSRADSIRRDFVANVSHELKTPLGALSVLAETIGDTGDDITRRRLATRLRDEATRMARLVDDILDLSHLESTDTTGDPVAVEAILEDAVRRVAVTAQERGIEITGKPPTPDVMVVGDRDLLVSAIANLLDNAVKYSGTTPDADRSVSYRADVDDEWVTIAVEDRGIGIPEAHLDRVFERFYRVDRARGRASGGTGLGLSIVHHVAINHGGEVSVESELGRGSTFTFRLPLWKG